MPASTADSSEVVVTPTGELEMTTAPPLDDELRALRKRGCAHIVVDLRGVTFMDSAGLRVLLSLRNDARRDGFALTLVRGPREVHRVFELTATQGLFDWREG